MTLSEGIMESYRSIALQQGVTKEVFFLIYIFVLTIIIVISFFAEIKPSTRNVR